MTPGMSQEEWRAISGFDGRYEVSDQGRVRSLRDSGRGWVVVRATPRILRTTPGAEGYPRVELAGRSRNVHRLVLEAFVGPCPNGYECAHLNGQRTDDRLVNLRWVTRSENQLHRRLHGTDATGERSSAHLHPERVARGERHGKAKLTEEQVREIRAALALGETQSSIGARFGVSPRAIYDIVRRRSWAHVDAPEGVR